MPVQAHKIRIVWELPTAERIEFTTDEGEEKSLVRHMGREFTLSLHPKSLLRPFLESWRGKEFEGAERLGFHVGKLIGVNCTLQVIHKVHVKYGKYATVGTIVPLMEGMSKIEPENETIVYEIEQPIPETCPDWLKEKIMSSTEKQEQEGVSEHLPDMNNVPDFDDDDPIPF